MKDLRKTDLAGLSPADQPIPMRQQIAYAVSEIAVNPIYTITLTFLTFFYTDVLGLNAALVGAIILVSKVFDGISDLWAGNLIDHTHTKAGSARNLLCDSVYSPSRRKYLQSNLYFCLL